MKKGMEEGMEKGLQEGLQEGLQKGKESTARNMKAEGITPLIPSQTKPRSWNFI